MDLHSLFAGLDNPAHTGSEIPTAWGIELQH
jgi:hypothetical protein